MRILIADDETISRTILERTLRGWGHDVVSVSNGNDAWKILSQGDAPMVAILDWMMPGMEGPEVCERVRALGRPVPPYLILLTAKVERGDVIAGLDSGADDYVTKPFDLRELRSRIKTGERILGLQRGLSERVRELEESLNRVKQLQGLLPICAWCKSVRNDGNYWQSVETYLCKHADVRFTHGICPDCLPKVVSEQAS